VAREGEKARVVPADRADPDPVGLVVQEAQVGPDLAVQVALVDLEAREGPVAPVV
jgi:hypothetical protein